MLHSAGVLSVVSPDASDSVDVREPPDCSPGVLQPDSLGLADHVRHGAVHGDRDGDVLQAGRPVTSDNDNFCRREMISPYFSMECWLYL